MKKISTIVLLLMYFSFSGCRITKVTQPVSADKNSGITISISVNDNLVPENNAHKGLVGILMPKDWQLEGGSYKSALGSGAMFISDDWADSIEAQYPASKFPGNMKWVALISDKGYTYQSAVDVDVELHLITGQTEGCFSLGYLVTKASPGLISSGQASWAPFSYPNKISLPLGSACENKFKAERAEDWNNLLDRHTGWTGSDGIYSIPMNMSEKPLGQDHLILFSDTFIGQVDSTGKRINTKMVNNTLAYLKGNKPVNDSIKFMWNNEGTTNPASMFIPNTPASRPGEYYWLMDGVKIQDTIHVFALRVVTTSAGDAMGFDLTGSSVISFNLSRDHRPENVRQCDLPFFYKNGSAHTVFGQAILLNTQESGNKNYDGYVYIYGPKSGQSKELLASRVRPEDLLNFSKWEFFNGTGWTGDFMSASPITNNLSQEFSVSELNGKYIIVFQTGSSVAVRMGETPVGPFDFYNEVYQCPEADISDNVFIYNAKAHPSLSDNTSLLISYNVNTMDFMENINNADVYRPRFIRLSVNDSTSGVKNKTEMPTAYRLLQNYPNPFNSSTKIEFELNKPEVVTLRVYNSLGQIAATLIEGKSLTAGRYITHWEATGLSSGIYFYSLETGTSKERRKMVLLK